MTVKLVRLVSASAYAMNVRKHVAEEKLGPKRKIYPEVSEN
jgi:hypothetical protein